jgi:hypothetical protein
VEAVRIRTLRVPPLRSAAVRVAQRAAVAAGSVAPIARAMHAVYALGLRIALDRLGRHPGVHSIYGCGSFFDGGCLYGHSDVDLIIVIDEAVTRLEGAHHDIGRTYERVRRFFPFLGRWGEKAANLVFLHEAQAGFPILESFRVRLKQGRLHRLRGPAFPIALADEPVTTSELLAECDALLRTAVITRGAPPRTALFWKRLFGKLAALAGTAGLSDAAAIAREGERRFGGDDRRAFFRPADRAECCAAWIAALHDVIDGLQRREPDATLDFTIVAPPASPSDEERTDELRPSLRRVLHAAGIEDARVRRLGSVPLGLEPELFYFSVDARIPFVDLGDAAYRPVRRLLTAMRRGAVGDAVLVRAAGLLFVVTRQALFTDLVPLDPLLHANVYAWVDGRTSCTVPVSLLAEMRAEARQHLRALAVMYERNDGWVPKTTVPCVYREDDRETIDNAFSTLRALAALEEPPIYLLDSAALAAHWARRHPESAAFLDLVLADLRFHRGESPSRPTAPNLYHCLHQFMRQALTESPTMALDDPHRGLGITVGIITRNRAGDLAEALASLERLTRRPDEVVIVDNGSTDRTCQVIEGFAGRLPIRYVFLGEPSIPRARNLVLEHATQEVVAFTDDDCAVDPEWLTAVERGFMRAANVGIVGGRVLHWPAPERSTVDTYFGLFHHNKP